jgi:exodeoxyribonuclease-3
MKRSRKLMRILFFLILTSSQIFAQGNFKILSYNVLYGFQNDSLIQNEFIQWVKEFDPDVIAYQEMNDFTQKSLENFAMKYGHPYAVMSKTDGFPVALSSKYPIVDVQKVLDNMWHAYLYANINGIHVFVIHFSPFSYKKRQSEVKEVLARAALIPKTEKIVIMGDFNSLSPSDSIYYSINDLNVLKEREKLQNHIRNLNNGNFDFSVVGSMIESGYIDILKKFNPGFSHSIPTKKYGENGFKRIDFIWGNNTISKFVKSSHIIYDHVTDRLSDHYPILTTFDF